MRPEDIAETIIVQVYGSEEEVTYQLDTPIDTGTLILQATPGYEDKSCGPISLKVNTMFTLVSLD